MKGTRRIAASALAIILGVGATWGGNAFTLPVAAEWEPKDGTGIEDFKVEVTNDAIEYGDKSAIALKAIVTVGDKENDLPLVIEMQTEYDKDKIEIIEANTGIGDGFEDKGNGTYNIATEGAYTTPTEGKTGDYARLNLTVKTLAADTTTTFKVTATCGKHEATATADIKIGKIPATVHYAGDMYDTATGSVGDKYKPKDIDADKKILDNGKVFVGWTIANDDSGTVYKPEEEMVLPDIRVDDEAMESRITFVPKYEEQGTTELTVPAYTEDSENASEGMKISNVSVRVPATAKGKNNETIGSQEVKQVKKSDTAAGSVNISDAAKSQYNSAGAGSAYKEVFFDFVLKDSSSNAITETNEPIEIILDYNMDGKSAPMIWRYHGGGVQQFSDARTRGDRTFYYESGAFHIFTSQFSTYALTYANGSGYSLTKATSTSSTGSKSTGSTSSASSTSSRSSSSSSSGGGGSSIGKVRSSGASKAYYSKNGKSSVSYNSSALKYNAKTAKVPATVKIGKKSYKVNSIASYAFTGYDKLAKLTVGKNVKKIEKEAFSGCKNLKAITINSSKLTKAKVKGALSGSSVKVVYVPADKVKAYKKIFSQKNVGKKVTVKAKKQK